MKRQSGLADSPFFTVPKKETADTSLLPKSEVAKKEKVRAKKHKPRKKPANQPRNQSTVTPGHHDTTVSRYHEAIVEQVRKAVKDLGKEAATHRFTVEEKKTIADIIYAYKNKQVRTSENEITRIAVNFILKDYQENGKRSILDKVLKALNE